MRDVANLVVPDVIELQDNDIAFAAVHALMRLEVLRNEFSQQFAVDRVSLSVLLRVSLIDLAIPVALTFFAGALTPILAAATYGELFERLDLTTLRAPFHNPESTR